MAENFISTVIVSDQEAWPMLKKKIASLLDFDTSTYRDNFLKRRIECRLRSLVMSSYSDYMNLLVRDEEERKKLHKELTIHVSHFFRDRTLYQELASWIIPQLVKEKMEDDDTAISIWSAGCSTGQEPYSIAMLLCEVLGANIGKFSLKIDATDIDLKTIAAAKEGIYEENSFIETDEYYRDKYFEKTDDQFRIKPAIRYMVNFRVGNIVNEKTIPMYDMILCRNTVIYFDKQAKLDLYVSLYLKLRPGGFLILGKTEFLDGTARAKFEVYNNNERIYRKPTGIPRD